jgi:hypothetical protein
MVEIARPLALSVVAFFAPFFGLAAGKTLPRPSRANVSRRRVN